MFSPPPPKVSPPQAVAPPYTQDPFKKKNWESELQRHHQALERLAKVELSPSQPILSEGSVHSRKARERIRAFAIDENQRQIDEENRLLITHLAEIVHKPSITSQMHLGDPSKQSFQPKAQLHEPLRKRRQKEINEENQALVKRIMGVKSSLSLKGAEKDFKRHKQDVDRMKTVEPPPSGLFHVRKRRPEGLAPRRLPKLTDPHLDATSEAGGSSSSSALPTSNRGRIILAPLKRKLSNSVSAPQLQGPHFRLGEESDRSAARKAMKNRGNQRDRIHRHPSASEIEEANVAAAEMEQGSFGSSQLLDDMWSKLMASTSDESQAVEIAAAVSAMRDEGSLRSSYNSYNASSVTMVDLDMSYALARPEAVTYCSDQTTTTPKESKETPHKEYNEFNPGPDVAADAWQLKLLAQAELVPGLEDAPALSAAVLARRREAERNQVLGADQMCRVAVDDEVDDGAGHMLDEIAGATIRSVAEDAVFGHSRRDFDIDIDSPRSVLSAQTVRSVENLDVDGFCAESPPDSPKAAWMTADDQMSLLIAQAVEDFNSEG
eukprot:TRINITY_DN12320_c0_g1_i1.p1 TRINITY_DN12320_c0_g1~~TRINITY_DN12320_c0_g1_i1.p1  ORF type:complete len:549 (+),score=128.36 TRINITY_DN12320_c0_g1_i1:70-1716(+)